MTLELFGRNMPGADEAPDWLEGCLPRLVVNGEPLLLVDPVPRPWPIWEMPRVHHADLPKGTLGYIPAGPRSPQGFAVSSGSGSVLVELGRAWVASSSRIDAAWVLGLPALRGPGMPARSEPSATALGGSGFPTALGWWTWLSFQRWPEAQRLLGKVPGVARIADGAEIWSADAMAANEALGRSPP